MRRLLLASILFGLVLSIHPSQVSADEKTDAFIKVAVAENNLFFNAILSKFMAKADLDYVPFHQPFNRSMWALSKGQVHMMGPYSESMVGEYALASGLSLQRIKKIPIAIDKIPMFGIYIKNINVRKSFTEDTDLIIGVLAQHSLSKQYQTQKLIKAKNLKQLVSLLQVGRVGFIVVPKQLVDRFHREFPDQKLNSTARPLFFESTFLFLSAEYQHLEQPLINALSDLTQTSLYETLWEKFSHEKEWQD